MTAGSVLPIARPDLGAGAAEREGRRLLIAVVDNDGFAREAITGLLRALGHEPLEFQCASDLLHEHALLRQIDCLITDMRMPALTGLDLHRELVAGGIVVPTIIVTAFPSDGMRAQVRAAGVRAYLPKPLTAGALVKLFETFERPTR